MDFPDIAQKVWRGILDGDAQRGIMICGTGVGAVIACNKIPGIRASCWHDVHSAHQCVEHDNVNGACIGAEIVGPTVACELVSEPFERTLLAMAKSGIPARDIGKYCDYAGLNSFARACHAIALINAGNMELC